MRTSPEIIAAALAAALACAALQAETADTRYYLTTLNGTPVTLLTEERSLQEGTGSLLTDMTEQTRMRVRTRMFKVTTRTRRVEDAVTLRALALEETREENGSATQYSVRVTDDAYTVTATGRQRAKYEGSVPEGGLFFRLDGEVLRANGRLAVGQSMRGYVIVAEEGSMAHLQVSVRERTASGGYLLKVENVSSAGTGWEEECSHAGVTEVIRVGGVLKRLVAPDEARLPKGIPQVSNALEATGRPEQLYKRRTVYLKLSLPGGNLRKLIPDSMYSGVLREDGSDSALVVLRSTYADGTLPDCPLSTEERKSCLAAGRLFEVEDPVIREKTEEALRSARGTGDLAVIAAVTRWTSRRLQGGRSMPAMASAVEAIVHRGGDCTEYAAVTVALLRKAGIPARMAFGLVFDGKSFQFHAWAEAYTEGRWVPADASYKRVGCPAAYMLLGYAEGGMGEYETRAMNLIAGGSVEFLHGNLLENHDIPR
ncbi:MAG: transglutaminase domain-containing protein [Planctomycetes bacterium]|nr:transglutaminase domain-containing protein [Planctomycetota bacterium]